MICSTCLAEAEKRCQEHDRPHIRKMARVLWETTTVPTEEIARRCGLTGKQLSRMAYGHGWVTRPWGQRGTSRGLKRARRDA